MEFKEYLEGKNIDSKAFKLAEPKLWQELNIIFMQMHPKSFTAQKLFLINGIRRKYQLPEGSQPETRPSTMSPKPKIKPAVNQSVATSPPKPKMGKPKPGKPVMSKPKINKPVVKSDLAEESSVDETPKKVKPKMVKPKMVRPVIKKTEDSESGEKSAGDEKASVKPKKVKPVIKRPKIE